MFLRKIHIPHFKVLKDIDVEFEQQEQHPVYTLASLNGGGKSTLLQFIFILLHGSFHEERIPFVQNFFDGFLFNNTISRTLAKFEIEYKKERIFLEFLIRPQRTLALGNKDICNFNNKRHTLSYKTNTTKNLQKIANQIFLAVPNTQVLHFLDNKAKKAIFSNRSYYEEAILKSKAILTGLFPYEFSSNEVILETFTKARDADFAERIRNKKYGTNFTETEEEFSNFLEGKDISTNETLSQIRFTITNTNTTLSPTDLSHGEMKKLSLFVWLKHNVVKDSLVLLDEIDIGFHPTWQYEIVNDLKRWTKNTQFMLATHSPEIISSTHYKNLLVLTKIKDNNKSTAKQSKEAPLDSDINTILKTIMGSDYRSKELQSLQKKYRALVDNGQIESAEAKELKKLILEYESPNSSFFQDIKFDLEIKG